MAARENQGLLIAVIIFVLLSLILALVAFMGISKASEYSDELEQMKADLAAAQDSSEAYQTQSQIMQAYIGFKEGGTLSEANQNLTALDNMGDSVKDIRDQTYLMQEEYAQDVLKYASNAGGEDQPTNTYKSLLANSYIVLGRKYNEANVYAEEVAQVERDRDTKLAAKQSQVDQAEKLLAKTQKEYEDAKADHQRNLKSLRSKIDEIEDLNTQLNESKTSALNIKDNEISILDGQIAELTRTKNILKEKVDDYEREVFDNPDGRILGVSPEIDMVVVNLGSADGLRPNRSFAVFSKRTTNFQKDQHKAKIEITRIVGAHQAEGRITMEDPLNPIITGDHILTAAWDPGFAIEFALSGQFDLDNDGNSDLTRLINDIERNGGKVVAYIDENGDVVGSIDAGTRYFVRGESPDPSDFQEAEDYRRLISSMKALEESADEYSVQNIDTKKLIDWMGLRISGKIERTDGRIGEQFRKRSPDNR